MRRETVELLPARCVHTEDDLSFEGIADAGSGGCVGGVVEAREGTRPSLDNDLVSERDELRDSVRGRGDARLPLLGFLEHPNPHPRLNLQNLDPCSWLDPRHRSG